jgi:probable HAF family extracellular repeat protein
VWDKGTKTDIGTLVPDGRFSEVFTINSKGQAAGYAATSEAFPDGFPFFHAIVWENGVIQDLSTLGGNNSFANSINNRSQVVGWADDLIVGSRAFLWEKGVMIDLGTLGGPNAVASAINEQGHVVGGAHINFDIDPMFGEPIYHAFLWDKGVFHDLGTLGGKLSFAIDINNRGQIIGVAQTAEILPDGFQVFHPFIWEKGVSSDLNDLIPLDSGWELVTAEGINGIGQIVGGGIINGEFHAFLLTPGHGNSDIMSSVSRRADRRANNIVSLHNKYRGLIQMEERRIGRFKARSHKSVL